MTTTQTRRSGSKSRPTKSKPAPPQFPGWHTSDEHEIERRRARGLEEDIGVSPLGSPQPVFGTFQTCSASGERYCVEIRSLEDHVNSCDCADHQVNGLGTCKHVEAILYHLKTARRDDGEAPARGNPRIEVFLDRRDGRVRIQWSPGERKRSAVRHLLAPFFSNDGTLLAEPLVALPAVQRAVENAGAAVQAQIRISRHLAPWLDDLRHRSDRDRARTDFEADVAAGKRSLDVLCVPLYPYQQTGMLHLAFTGRALLADEMGLGKTIQAIAACELLRRHRGIQRVLVVMPASLKAEWEEQIAKCTSLPSLVIRGPRAARLRQYRESSFFYLTNYEQVRPDRRELNEVLSPDVIILDEAQRIKNWQTRTAEGVKRLSSRYAFVLTGTPIENRIDEIYSIVQFLDPRIFGPLFRFNRDFYDLDERGRPVGYKNLDELHRRLRPIMLRRRKDEVEDQLPGRTVNTYFVGMAPEQQSRYEEYGSRVARLMAQARRRPLMAQEMDRLQKWLACMRMLCDTPYILDQACRVAPKIEELRNIIGELMETGEHKLIIFSEWERMLELVRELCDERSLHYAWHTGSTPQDRRRKEIRRFKDDPECRLFLSTDSGSVGLNLQVADVVINLDLPWNPAKLEQRIARAWRKHQRRVVQVIHFVTEHSIEHRMLGLLDQKRTLAQSVVDGAGELKQMTLPSGRAAFIERLQSLVGGAPPAAVPHAPIRRDGAPREQLREDVLARWGGRLDLLDIYRRDGQAPTVIAVLDKLDDSAPQSLATTVETHLGGESTHVEVLDRATYETIQRLIAAGVLTMTPHAAETLHRSPALAQRHHDERERRLAEARRRFADVGRQQRMAQVLAEGGFPREALPPLQDALQTAFQSLLHLQGVDASVPVTRAVLESNLVDTGVLPAEALSILSRLRQDQADLSDDQAKAVQNAGHRLLEQAGEAFERKCLSG